MKRVHYVEKYLTDPQHPVTVNLIGAGGTGSQVLSCLVRIDMALAGLGQPNRHGLRERLHRGHGAGVRRPPVQRVPQPATRGK